MIQTDQMYDHKEFVESSNKSISMIDNSQYLPRKDSILSKSKFVTQKSVIRDKNEIPGKSLFNKSAEQKQAIEREIRQINQEILVDKKTSFEKDLEASIPIIDESVIKRVETLKIDTHKTQTRERKFVNPLSLCQTKKLRVNITYSIQKTDFISVIL